LKELLTGFGIHYQFPNSDFLLGRRKFPNPREEIMLSSREKQSKEVVKGKYGDSTFQKPNGILSARIGDSYDLREWIDGKIPLEEQLYKTIASIEFRGLKKREERIEREKKRAIEEERKRIAKELQDKKEKELREFKDIFRKSKRHEQSEVIRRYAFELGKWSISRNESLLI
jgi:signal transduction histidine kinase